ncbi:MAG: hypothetical protein OMM_02131 [Candidatus Magnetoglobus multicellularis str. Araruama]|uniref:Uncharacterized protein n=1 Tax=Candidatus Magnetoglobus multicellularis str. Araruama TaxID=890399 RepID=A0A1V1PAV0_9BACT|nr:MAG: hypothetical protein OMM_02131 [Candidatus Magnetoglobus multicellularis str. Araruama]
MISKIFNKMSVKYVESLMLEKFKKEPFHNLYFLFNKKPENLSLGGTCSDKTLSFYNQLRRVKIESHLHSAFIKKQEIHRLVSITLNNKIYYADIGNGWPSIKLFPKDREIKYNAYGMIYQTIIKSSSLDVYLSRDGKKYHSVEIPFHSKKHEDIMEDINNRFNKNITYPFTGGIRFSQIVQDHFLFFRDDTLSIYSYDHAVKKISGISKNNLAKTLKQYFNFDMEKILKTNQ